MPGSNVSVLTDSVASISPEVAAELGIRVVPFVVVIGGDQFLDGIDLTPSELYRRMRNEGILPHTSHPSVGAYLNVFRQCIAGGAGSIVYVGMSSMLSGALGAAKEAAELLRVQFPETLVYLVDTRTGAMSEGYIAIEAAKQARRGGSAEEVVAVAEDTKKRVGLVLSLDTLEYLARGGRIGRAASLLGSLLGVKPVLTIGQDGVVEPVGRTRGMNSAMRYMVEHVAERASGGPLKLSVMHADAIQRARELLELAKRRLRPESEVYVAEFTPVMGAHVGPGLVGLAYCRVLR